MFVSDATMAIRSTLPGHALAAALGAALAEGMVAALAVRDQDGSLGAAVVGFALAALAIFAVVGAIMTVIQTLADTRVARDVGSGIQRAFGGSVAITTSVALVAVGAAIFVGTRVGVRLLTAMTPPFAVALTTIATIGLLVLVAMTIAPAGAALARVLGERAHGRMAMGALVIVATVGLIAVLLVQLPTEYAPLPGAILASLAALQVFARPRRVFNAASTRVGWITLPLAVLIASVLAVTVIEAADSSVRGAVFRRAPYVGNLVAFVWRVTDADGDGYSPYLAGGDCDDGNPEVRPDAAEIIGNGIDDNCSGGGEPSAYEPVESPDAIEVRTPQNIVLLQMDALRPDHLGFAGYERPTSPNLDRFRAGATWFRRAYTNAPSTRFAMSTVFTGFDARRLAYTSPGRNGFVLGEDANTVAEALTRLGYDTFGVTITYVLDHNRGLGQGFRSWTTPWPQHAWRANYPVAAERTTDALLEYLDQRPPEAGPYLAFAHYRCTHDPYIAYEQWPYGRAPIDRYDSALNYCDDQLARVFEVLDARSDRERTAIVVFSDHGELFGEHGLTSHGRWLYEEDLRVLVLADIPGFDKETVEAPVTLADLGVTLFELGGATPPAESDGWSLLVHGSEPVPDRPLFFFTDLWVANVHVQATALTQWPLKYIRDVGTGTVQIFDVENDPRETRNLADDSARAEERESMSMLLDAHEAYLATHPSPATGR